MPDRTSFTSISLPRKAKTRESQSISANEGFLFVCEMERFNANTNQSSAFRIAALCFKTRRVVGQKIQGYADTHCRTPTRLAVRTRVVEVDPHKQRWRDEMRLHELASFLSENRGDECNGDVHYLISSKCREAGIHRYSSVPERWLTM